MTAFDMEKYLPRVASPQKIVDRQRRPLRQECLCIRHKNPWGYIQAVLVCMCIHLSGYYMP